MINEVELPFGSWDWQSFASQHDHQRSECRSETTTENLYS